MAISEACAVLNRMEADGIIKRYALAGAVAAYAYIEAVHTEDLDVLVALTGEGVDMLAPIWAYLRERGYTQFRHAGVVVGGWPVEFSPIAGALDAEGLDQAQDVELEPGLTVRVLRPQHLVATALSVGRPKDHVRIAQFLEDGAVNLTELCALLDRHGLTDKWRAFCFRHDIADPCADKGAQPDAAVAAAASGAASGTTAAHPYADILAAHALARRERAALSLAAKVARTERVGGDVRLFKVAREARKLAGKTVTR
jgi:hypothetical protein